MHLQNSQAANCEDLRFAVIHFSWWQIIVPDRILFPQCPHRNALRCYLGVLILAPVTKLAQISVRFLHHSSAAGTFDVDVRQPVVD